MNVSPLRTAWAAPLISSAAVLTCTLLGGISFRGAPASAQVIAFTSPGVPTARPLTTLDRIDVAAEWLGVDDAGRLKFHLPPPEKTSSRNNSTTQPDAAVGTEFAVAPADFVAWGAPVEAPRGLSVLLVDGSLLAVDNATCDSEDLRLKTLGQEGKIPLTQVRGLIFRSFGTHSQRDRLFDAVAGSRTGDRDRVVMLSGDETTGTVKSVDFEGITLETSLGPAVIPRAKVSYLIFNPALAAAPPKPGLRMLIGHRSGSLIVSDPPTPDADGRVRIQPTAKGGDFSLSVNPSDIVFLQTLGGKATFLSSLEPTGYRHVPYLERTWPYHADRNVTGLNLRAGGRRYASGLGMHSASRITYPLDGTATHFAASLAIDDETDGRGSVAFRVFVDGEEKYRSPIVRGGERPIPIEVPIAGGKQLSLVVDFADFADEQDHADWLNARLLP